MEKRQKDHVRNTFLNNLHPVKTKEKITALFEFSPNGNLKRILLNSQDERDQLILQRSIERLISPHHFGWLRGLFK